MEDIFILMIVLWPAALVSILVFYLWPQLKLWFPRLTGLRLAELVVVVAILVLLLVLICPATYFQSARY